MRKKMRQVAAQYGPREGGQAKADGRFIIDFFLPDVGDGAGQGVEKNYGQCGTNGVLRRVMQDQQENRHKDDASADAHQRTEGANTDT